MKIDLKTICLFILIAKVKTSCDKPHAIYIVPGDIYLSGIFNGHSGENCSTPVPLGLQQMAAAISVIKILQDTSFINGLKIGLALYDGCSSSTMAQKAVVSAAVEAECIDGVTVGILSIPEICISLKEITNTLSLPVIATSSPFPGPFLFDISVSLLVSLGWNRIDLVLADDSLMLDTFEEFATNSLLCIRRRQLVTEEILDFTEVHIIIVLTNGADFEKLLTKVKQFPEGTNLLFVPLDGELMTLSDGLPSQTYVILPSLMNDIFDFVPNSTTTVSNSSGFSSDLELLEEIQSPVFVQMASDILQIVTYLKSKLAIYCPDTIKGFGMCNNFKLTKDNILTHPALHSGKLTEFILNLVEEENEDFEVFQVLKSNLNENTGYTKIGGYKLNEGDWSLVLESENISFVELCRNDPFMNSSGVDCSHCFNFKKVYEKKYEEMRERENIWSAVEWKSEAWVAAVLTISVVGIICVFAVTIFITVRICKQDILEGNPTFTFLLLISVVISYISCGSFTFTVLEGNPFYLEMFCNIRIFGTSLSYSLMFSIMLARSVMIASCDQDGGFMSHISGYLQFVICFFIVIVQIALCIQFFAINWKFLTTNECISMTKGYIFIALLSYNIFLLLLLVFTAPFIMKSKRNYHEGGFFAVASVLCLFIWCGWITAFFLSTEKWHDMITTCGLCGTATALVVTIFIPRTYLMMTGIIRDHLASNLPSLAYASTSSVIDVNYRSTQALYDSVHPVSISKGQLNPNFYTERPGTPSTSKMDSIQRPEQRPDNTYERYDTPTSPLNVTRF